MLYLWFMSNAPVTTLQVRKINSGIGSEADDFLACEEPLEIRLVTGAGRMKTPVSVTMRTPGNDNELAAGFLFTEGILKNAGEIEGFQDLLPNVIEVELKAEVMPALDKLSRNFYTTSSCGVCGKSSIDAVRIVSGINMKKEALRIPAETFYALPEKLKLSQEVFTQTGGLHASALFDLSGNLVLVKEDVGRHNALDKLIGKCFLEGKLPLHDNILLLSGRASFELIQKAVMAGISVIAAVGAPSSLAVELAQEFGLTLLGFLRGERFNIYCGEERILF